jgi:hypothetical protein
MRHYLRRASLVIGVLLIVLAFRSVKSVCHTGVADVAEQRHDRDNSHSHRYASGLQHPFRHRRGSLHLRPTNARSVGDGRRGGDCRRRDASAEAVIGEALLSRLQRVWSYFAFWMLATSAEDHARPPAKLTDTIT